jgi:hypothetical protein
VCLNWDVWVECGVCPEKRMQTVWEGVCKGDGMYTWAAVSDWSGLCVCVEAFTTGGECLS